MCAAYSRRVVLMATRKMNRLRERAEKKNCWERWMLSLANVCSEPNTVKYQWYCNINKLYVFHHILPPFECKHKHSKRSMVVLMIFAPHDLSRVWDFVLVRERFTIDGSHFVVWLFLTPVNLFTAMGKKLSLTKFPISGSLPENGKRNTLNKKFRKLKELYSYILNWKGLRLCDAGRWFGRTVPLSRRLKIAKL